MTQVWLIDSQGFYLNESKFVEEVSENMTTTPLLIGYIKARLVDNEWIEGATEQEIAEYEASKQIDNCLPVSKTNAELTAEIDSLNSFIEELLFDILPNLTQGGEL